MAAFNEKKFNRKEIPAKVNVDDRTFTGLLSSAGQIVVPAELRNGRIPGFTMPEGCKVEVTVKAVHYQEK